MASSSYRPSDIAQILNGRPTNTISKDGWNSSDPNFKKKGIFRCDLSDVLYTLVFPRFMFKDNANKFNDIESEEDGAIVHFALIQYIWFCLYWASVKISATRTALDNSPYPYRVLIEDIEDDDQEHVEYRMYILTNRLSQSSVELGELLATACRNVSYKINQEGEPLGNSKESKKKSIDELYSSVRSELEFHKKITSPDKLTKMISIVCNIDIDNSNSSRASRVYNSIPDDDDNDNDDDNMQDAGDIEQEKRTFSECFSVVNAFSRVDHSASGHQRIVQNYVRNNTTFELDCDRFNVYEVNHNMWHPSVMKRRLLHKEVDIDVIEHDRRIGQMKEIIRQHSAKRPRHHDRNGGGDEEDSVDENDNGGADELMNRLAELTLDNLDRHLTSNAEDCSIIVATRVQEDRRDMALFTDSRDSSKMSSRMENDPLRRLKKKLSEQLKIIREAFNIQGKVGTIEHNLEIAKAKQSILIEYANSSISPNMDKARQTCSESRFDVPDVKIPITDLSLSATDNFLKFVADGAYHHLDVTYHGTILTKLFVGTGDHWRAVKGDHLNWLLTGDAATGKSFMMTQLMKMLGDGICTCTDRQSRRRFAQDGYESDIFEFSDENDFSAMAASKDGEMAELRTRMTSCEVTSEIMDLQKGDGERGSNKRDVRFFRYEYIAQYIKCTNISANKVAKSNNLQREGTYALISRFACQPVNAVNRQGHRTVNASNSKISKDENAQAAKERFINTTRLIHRIRGEYYHAVIIGAVPDPCMEVYDQTVNLYMKKLEKYGIRSANHRFSSKMALYCMALATLRAIINQYFVPTGIYYGKKYETQQLASLVVICNEDDAVSTFSAFFNNMCPTEMDVVIKTLDSAKSGENGFDKTYCEIKLRDKNENIAHSDNFNPVQMQQEDNQQQQQQQAPQKLPIKADFMRIKNKSPSKIVDYISKMTKNDTTQPSHAILENCLDILQEMTVLSDSYVLNPGETVPVVDHQRGREMRFGLIYEGGDVYINTHLIFNKEIYSNLLVSVIRESFHKGTSERKVLLMVPHSKYPWLFTSIQMERRPDVTLQVENPHYVSNHTMLTSIGISDRSKLPIYQQKQYIEVDGDVDVVCLLKNISRYYPTKMLKPEDVVKWYHHQMLRKAMKDYYVTLYADERDEDFYARFEDYPQREIDETEEMDRHKILNDYNNLADIGYNDRLNLVAKQSEMITSQFITITPDKIDSCMSMVKSMEMVTRNNNRSASSFPMIDRTYGSSNTSLMMLEHQNSMAGHVISKYDRRNGNSNNNNNNISRHNEQSQSQSQTSMRVNERMSKSDLDEMRTILPSISRAHFRE